MDTHPPFARHTELTATPSLPAAPIPTTIRAELSTPILDSLSPYLHFIARKSPSHTDPLHVQKIKGRRILIAENPGLHLVWYYDVVYLKPIPAWLGNWEFWRRWICHVGGRCMSLEREGEGNGWCPIGAACGFLRTYAFLIQHPSDFRIAVEAGLLPDCNIDYHSFLRFITQFRDIPNNDVPDRYHYGQLRLTRLNWAVRLLRTPAAKGAWNYHEMYWQTGQYIERLFGPLMFGFASVSIVLQAMQVVVSIPESNVMSRAGWETFRRASWGFSSMAIAFVVWMWFAIVLGISILILAQLVFSVRQLRRQ